MTSRAILRITLLGSLLATTAARAGFDDRDHFFGLMMGAGTYFHPIASQSLFDPVPALAPTGTTVAGSQNVRLLPLKLGFFKELPGRTFVEAYARYTLSSGGAWTTTGTLEGSGTTKFYSVGAGMNFGFTFFMRSRFRMQFLANGEYVKENAALTYTTGGPAERLSVTSGGSRAGIGLRPELWLGDMWVLSLLTAYQYGFKSQWSAAKASTFFGVDQSGPLKDANGALIPAQHSGVLVEACLKLNFL
ncbi:MAG: hypothetical protein JST16_10535 [Bdellovibrionales bacterium]|nr:hypothetical protein [Bdellovibrionales bacterium]